MFIIFASVIKCSFKKLSQEVRWPVTFLPMCTHYGVLFFFLKFQASFCYHFLSAQRIFFNYSSGFLATNSLCFSSSERCLFPPLHTWRLFSLNTELRHDPAFPSVLRECCATSYWVKVRIMGRDKKCTSILTGVLLKRNASLLFLFFFFGFRSSILMCLSRISCFDKLGKFSVIISSHTS